MRLSPCCSSSPKRLKSADTLRTSSPATSIPKRLRVQSACYRASSALALPRAILEVPDIIDEYNEEPDRGGESSRENCGLVFTDGNGRFDPVQRLDEALMIAGFALSCMSSVPADKPGIGAAWRRTRHLRHTSCRSRARRGRSIMRHCSEPPHKSLERTSFPTDGPATRNRQDAAKPIGRPALLT